MPERATETGIADFDDPETLEIIYGEAWRDHLVPDPEEFAERTAIGDLAPGAENDTPPNKRGPNSDALLFHISSAYAGHPEPPSPEEIYRAFHTPTPTRRTRALIRAWMNDALETDFFDAWRDHCYTWRELAAACRRHGINHGINAPAMNRMPRRQTAGTRHDRPTGTA